MTEYIIIGDTAEYEGCLVYVIKGTKEDAEKVLDRMLNNPDEYDLKKLEKHTNLRIKAVEKEDQWWNDPFLMSD